jgi:DNA-binding transcriptional ArsR family regulator
MPNHELGSNQEPRTQVETLSLIDETSSVMSASETPRLNHQQIFRSVLPPNPAVFLAVSGDQEVDVGSAAKVLAGLGHAVRLEVLRLVVPHGTTGLSAGCIATRLMLARSSLSFHLSQMVQEKILIQRRAGRQIIYTANSYTVAALCKFLEREIGQANSIVLPIG